MTNLPYSLQFILGSSSCQLTSNMASMTNWPNRNDTNDTKNMFLVSFGDKPWNQLLANHEFTIINTQILFRMSLHNVFCSLKLFVDFTSFKLKCKGSNKQIKKYLYSHELNSHAVPG